jgi:hypothetical protein
MFNMTGIYFATETNLFKREAEGRTKDNPKEAQPANTETNGVRELEWPFSKWYTALSGKDRTLYHGSWTSGIQIAPTGFETTEAGMNRKRITLGRQMHVGKKGRCGRAKNRTG